MGNSFSAILIIVIAVVIFIVRLVADVNNRKEADDSDSPSGNQKQRPQVNGDRIGPIHFELKDDEEPSGAKHFTAARQGAGTKPSSGQKALRPKNVQASKAYPSGDTEFHGTLTFETKTSPATTAAMRGKLPSSQAPSGQGGLPLYLGKLSPLQQAVVMAEVLGKPKGLDL